MLCAGVPVRFRVVLAVQVLVNVTLGFVEHLHEREGCTRRHLFCQHGCVLRQPCSHYGFGCISFWLAFPVHQIQQLHNKGLWQIVQHFFQRVRIFVQQGRRAQLRHEIQIVTGYRLLAVVDALTGVIQHIFDCVLCRVGKLLHQSNTVCKADLRLVSFAGAAARLPIARVSNLAQAIRTIKEHNIFVYCADLGGAPLAKTDLSGPVALVLGSEGSGVSQLVKKLCDGVVSLDMTAQGTGVDSFNVSVAAGIILYEIQSQRAAQG